MEEQQKHINEFDEIRSRIRSNNAEGDTNFEPDNQVWDKIVMGVNDQKSRKKYLWLILFFCILVILVLSLSNSISTNYQLNQMSVSSTIETEENSLIENTSKLMQSFDSSDDQNASSKKSLVDLQKPLFIASNQKSVYSGPHLKGGEELSTRVSSNTEIDHVINNDHLLQSSDRTDENLDVVFSDRNLLRSQLVYPPLPLIEPFLSETTNLNIPDDLQILVKPSQEIFNKMYIAASLDNFRSGYHKTYQSLSATDMFDLVGRNGWGLAVDIGVRVDNNFTISGGVIYRKINFDAEYGLTMESQLMNVDRNANGEYIAHYNRNIPSLAGGLNTDIFTSYRGGAVIPSQDVGFNLSLGHAYRTISFPILVQYVTGFWKGLNAEIGMGGSYTHRYVTIDTEINQSGYHHTDYSLNDIHFSAITSEVMPFRSNYFTGLISAGFSYDCTNHISFQLLSRIERSLGDIYLDDRLSVSSSNHSILLGVRYYLR